MRPLKIPQIISRVDTLQNILIRQCRSNIHRYSTSAIKPTMRSGQGTVQPKHSLSRNLPPLSIMPARLLFRSYFITSILASPKILKICLPLMNKIADSESRFLNPDWNPLLHVLVRRLVYDHFAAGENEIEVKKSVAAMKKLGFKGVILGYNKEVSVTKAPQFEDIEQGTKVPSDLAIQEWKEGTLKTLDCIGEDDFLAVKVSGAGASTLEALNKNLSPPPKMWKAMHEICEAAATKKTRLWIDAEQQNLQPTIDLWTIELMRKYNLGEKAMVYTTMQAYLKHTSNNILAHLKIAQEEGWILGIKLVRGAYIATEQRDLIHDTIEDTHKAYDGIAEQLLKKSFPGVPSSKPYPSVALMLATHNDESIQKAYAIQRSRIQSGESVIEISYGQLQGMADEVSCRLLQLCQAVEFGKTIPSQISMAPNAFKCLSWGTTQECLQFLLRRVKENKDALGRTEDWMVGFRQELWRRIRNAWKFT